MAISTIGSNSLNQTSDLTINGQTVGKGGGNVATNTVHGVSAGVANTTGDQNTFIGTEAGYSNVTGVENTFVGRRSGYLNTGNYNTALGTITLRFNTSGAYNTAIGDSALYTNTTGSYNTAIGYQAGNSNAQGSANTFLGYQAGYTFAASSATSTYNTFLGYSAGYLATTGTNNTFVGNGAGQSVTTGGKNTILGNYGGNQGGVDIRTASNFIVLSDGDGNPRVQVNGSGSMTVPQTYNDTTASGANMFVNASGSYYRSTSALKYKQDVRDLEDMDISTLRPVRYKSKCAGDDQTKDHLGLIADEAAEAGFEELVTRGDTGEVEGFQYERLTVVLLKSLQELKTIVDAQAAEIAELKAKVA